MAYIPPGANGNILSNFYETEAWMDGAPINRDGPHNFSSQYGCVFVQDYSNENDRVFF
jgi:hypothetical protein